MLDSKFSGVRVGSGSGKNGHNVAHTICRLCSKKQKEFKLELGLAGLWLTVLHSHQCTQGTNQL